MICMCGGRPAAKVEEILDSVDYPSCVEVVVYDVVEDPSGATVLYAWLLVDDEVVVTKNVHDSLFETARQIDVAFEDGSIGVLPYVRWARRRDLAGFTELLST